MKLLIADDSLLVRNTLKRLIKAMEITDIHILEARNGQEAVDIFCGQKPDALIVDLLMPNIDGMGVLSHIDKTENTCFVAVLSSNVQEPVKKKCMDLGADIFIEKPITLEKIKYFFIKKESLV